MSLTEKQLNGLRMTQSPLFTYGMTDTLASMVADEFSALAKGVNPEIVVQLLVNVAVNAGVQREALQLIHGADSAAEGAARSFAQVYARAAAIVAERAGIIERNSGYSDKASAETLNALGIDPENFEESAKNRLLELGIPENYIDGDSLAALKEALT